MNRNHFKKNPNQDDLFDIASQINDVKLLSDTISGQKSSGQPELFQPELYKSKSSGSNLSIS